MKTILASVTFLAFAAAPALAGGMCIHDNSYEQKAHR